MNDEIRRLDAIIYDDSRDTPERFAACLKRYYAQCRYFGIDPNPPLPPDAGTPEPKAEGQR
jgi:hypothetical protein